jgi:PKD repeat protein
MKRSLLSIIVSIIFFINANYNLAQNTVYSPAGFSVNIGCSGTKNVTLNIQNSGLSKLKWNGSTLNSRIVFSPLSDSILPSASGTVSVTINSSGLSVGSNLLYAIINTNKATHPIDSIPITVNVLATPCVKIGVASIGQCNGSVSFIDSSSGNATSWLWKFGDGDTSTLKNPMHTYTSAGNYIVKLLVTNSFGTDSSTQIIILTNVGGPNAANCTSANFQFSNYGIKRVKFNTINNSSGSSMEGYKDFTCLANTALNPTTQYILTVVTESLYERVYAWIDYDNNNDFSVNEQVALIAPSLFDTVHTAIISIPTSGIVLNAPLRMRISSSNYLLADACSFISSGQCEDYTVKIIPTISAPVANFYLSSDTIGTGMFLTLSDLSSNGPSNWSWIINGGALTSSNSQNPLVSFNTAGTYNIILTVSNTIGSSSITKSITVLDAFLLCSPTSSQVTNAVSGFLFDSGGPILNYGDNQNCTLLISPPCADTIKLKFSQFFTENNFDIVRVYDGLDASAPLLLIATGFSTPSEVNATSGHMYVQFTSNYYNNYSGFEATWSSVQYSEPPPVANFSFNPINAPLLDTVQFIDLSGVNAKSWSWNFGDGTTSTLKNPKHQYSTSGNFTVKLIATSCLASDSISKMITIQAPPNAIYTPTSLSVNLGCNDTANLNLNIQNTGLGTLNWTSPNIPKSGNNLLIWCYGSDFSFGGKFRNTISALNQFYTNYILDTTATSNPNILQSKLIGKKVLLITPNDFGGGNASMLCSSVIQNFVQNGGILIISSDNYTMQGLGIFNYTFSSPVYDSLYVSNTSTQITNNVQPSFNYSSNTTYRQITDFNRVKLVADPAGNDVVSYKPFGFGKAIYMGFDFTQYDVNIAYLLSNAVAWGMNTYVSDASPYVIVSPLASAVLPLGSTNVNVQVNSNGLSGGTYTVYAYFKLNNPAHLKDSIPIVLNVSASPCSKIGYDAISNCLGIVSFKDNSINSPTSWLWKFGDGFTSTLKNPSHTYASIGSYMVKLIVANSAGIDSTFSIVKVLNIGGPISTSCFPMNIQDINFGIKRVNFNTINNVSASSFEGYKDFSCFNNTTINPGTQYVFSVSTVSSSEIVYAWIDFDNSGTFSFSERVVYSTNIGDTLHQAIVYIPTGAILNTPLRMRIISSYFNISNSCAAITYGQCEDYSVTIVSATGPPIANFNLGTSVIIPGTTLMLSDLSTNSPTAWNWNINSGSPSSSTAKNVSTTFNNLGTYQITLTSSNSFGNSSITKTIKVENQENLCYPTQQKYSTDGDGSLYDSGGPLGSYSNHENCSMLISPLCADSIEFKINSFQTESGHDYLIVFDGANATDPILLNATGTIPFTKVVGTSGNLSIRFYSDGFGVNSGFEAEWHAIPQWKPFILKTGSLNPGSSINFGVNSTKTITGSLWDFGDGSASISQTPTHAFTTVGTYIVSLQLTEINGCLKTIYDTLNIYPTSLNKVVNDLSIKVYPNPFNDNIQIQLGELAKSINIKMYDVLGREVYQSNEDKNQSKDKKISINPNVPTGIYFLHLEIDGRKAVYKVTKSKF